MKKRAAKTIDIKISKGNIAFFSRIIPFMIIAFLMPWVVKLFEGLTGLGRIIQFKESYIVYSFAFMLLLFYVYSRKKIADMDGVKIEPVWAVLFTLFSAVCFALFFVFTHMVAQFKYGLLVYVAFSIAEFALGLMLLFMAFFGFEFFRRFYAELLVSFFILFDFLVLTVILTIKWRVFSGILATANFHFLKIFFPDTQMALNLGDPVLQVNDFRIVIGEPCSGIESIIMFLIFGIFIMLLDWKRIEKRKLWILIPGLLGMFFMSLVRILLLMVVGQVNPAFAITMFHTNVGWILFVIYLMVFWYFAYPWMLKPSLQKRIVKRMAKKKAKIARRKARKASNRQKVKHKISVRSVRKRNSKRSKSGKSAKARNKGKRGKRR